MSNTALCPYVIGIQSYALFLPPAVEHGVNASIESIYHVLVDIQSKFSETPDKLNVQGPSHPLQGGALHQKPQWQKVHS